MIPFFRRQPAADRVSPALQQIAESVPMQSEQRLTPHSGDVQEKRSILRNLFQSDDMITVPNNTTVDIPRGDGKKAVRLYAQSLAGEDSLTESTNSAYCRISELISFSWEPLSHVNLLAVHRTKPLVAYVINTVYHKAVATGKQMEHKPEDQMVRLVNYENQCRALCRPIAEAQIADIAFSFDSPKREDSNLIVVVDRMAIINLLSFRAFHFTNAAPQLSLTRLMTIRSNMQSPAGHIRLSWCVYVPGDGDEDEPVVDPSLRLAVTTGTTLEVFTFNDFHLKSQDVTVDRSHFKVDMGEYYVAHNIHEKDIVSTSISNDGSLTCTASQSNVLLFYAIEDAHLRMQYLREWKPLLPDGELIAHSSFLDDIDYLLDHPDQMFWGYLFVGSSSGHMYIYDLQGRDWALIQELNVICEENEPPGARRSFSYHVDKSSKVILAVRHRSVFVFLLQFSEDEKGTRFPRIKQVARMQLYNDVISIQVKQPSETEIEIFWITLKNLERCTIDVQKMDEGKLVGKPNRTAVDGAASLAKALIRDRKLTTATSPKEQELLNKLQEKSNELISMKKKQEPVSAVSTSPASNTTPDARVRTQSTGFSPAPASDPMSSLLDKLVSNGQQQKPKLPHAPSISSPPVTAAPALNDMAKIMLIEDKLKTFENRFTKQLDIMSGTIATSLKTVHSDISQLRAELQQPAKQSLDRSLVELTINNVVDKTMKQMNVLIAKGLKDFFDQTDVGIGELQTTVIRSNNEIRTAFGEAQEQITGVKSQMDLFVKQMERLDAQQQLLLFRYQQLIDQQ